VNVPRPTAPVGGRLGLVGAVVTAILAHVMGCFSYSSYQDARIAPKGESQATLSISASSYKRDYMDERQYWYPVEVAPRFHVATRFDAGLRMSLLLVPGEERATGVFVVGGDIRGAVIPNHLVLSLPVAFAVGDNPFSTFQLQPGAVVTLPVLHQLDLNGSVHWYVYTGDLWGDQDDLNSWGYTAGLGWHMTSRVTLRPEVGWLVFSDQDLIYTQYGVGLTLRAPIGSDPELGH
jgi:hypothetical protein